MSSGRHVSTFKSWCSAYSQWCFGSFIRYLSLRHSNAQPTLSSCIGLTLRLLLLLTLPLPDTPPDTSPVPCADPLTALPDSDPCGCTCICCGGLMLLCSSW